MAGKRSKSTKKKNAYKAEKTTKAATKRSRSGKTGEGASEKAKKSAVSSICIAAVIFIIAVLFVISLIFPSDSGAVGPIINTLLGGLFARSCVFIPIVMIFGAFMLKGDRENGLAVWKTVASVILIISIACLTHIVKSDAITIADWSNVTLFWKNGVSGIGGGAVGGLIGSLLCKFVGKIATIIIFALLIIVSGFFFIGLTLYRIALRFGYFIKKTVETDAIKREAVLRREEEIAAEEEARYNAAMEAQRAEIERQAAMADRVNRRKRLANEFASDRSDANAEADGDIYEEKPDGGRRRKFDLNSEEIKIDHEDRTSKRRTRDIPELIRDADQATGRASETASGMSDGDTDKQDNGIVGRFGESFGMKVISDEGNEGTSETDIADGKDADPEKNEEILSPEIIQSIIDKQSGITEDIDENDDDFDGDADIFDKIDDISTEGVDYKDDNPISAEIMNRFLEHSDTNGEGKAFDVGAKQNIEGLPDAARALVDPDSAEPKTPLRRHRDYVFPPINLLATPVAPENTDVADELQTTAKKLVDTLTSFKVRTKIVNISRGPTITRYELAPEEGIRVRQIANLVDDISLSLATSGVRIEAPIPGKAAVGIEVPNRVVATVFLQELVNSEKFRSSTGKVTVALGEDVAGDPIFVDISKMPHLLVAGATGMGKSVCINSMIVSLLYKASPEDVKLILIDPKKVELNIYNGLPHLLVPVVSDPKRAAGALQWAVTEMERRFNLIEEVGARDLKGYNKAIENDPERGKLESIVIIIDELADLMMTAPDDVEESICRLAQKARAAGMHLIIGTQRPSVDVITGLIKANIPSRIAFTVASQVDSRTIIDITGAEKLIGRGDMLFAPVGSSKPIRVQGAFVSEDEILSVIGFIKRTYGVGDYDEAIIDSINEEAEKCGNSGKKGSGGGASYDDEDAGDDPMLSAAIELAVDSGKISTSLIQRRLSLGYGRAAKLIDRMERMGIVSAPEGQKPRSVLITKQQYMEMRVKNSDML